MQIVPHPINRAFFADPLIGEDSNLTELLGKVIAHAGYGLVLVNRDRQIIYATDAAKALMRANRFLHNHNGSISATDFNLSRRLQSLILAATGGQTGEPVKGGSLIHRDEGGAATLVVHVVPLSRRPAELPRCHRSNVAGLLIFDCQRDIFDRVRVFSELFALTSAETRVLSQLLLTGGVTQAAMLLKIAQSTAQTHLKRILEKTGTHRQVELVKLFYEVTIPWCGHEFAKLARISPWQAAWMPAAADTAEEARAPRRSGAVK
jgi:DNA-binding CsgD family transcriptional regulator